MNSVSRVACTSATREYLDRPENVDKSEVNTCVTRYVRTVVNNEDAGVCNVRRMSALELDGIVVEISVCTSTKVNRALYT